MKGSVRKLMEELAALTKTVEKLTAELEHRKEIDQLEREKLILQLQNTLSQFELRLPPPR